MIPAVVQTLANVLTESPLIRTVQIDLSHPSKRRDIKPAISLYLYDLRETVSSGQLSVQAVSDGLNSQDTSLPSTASSVAWLDLTFLIIAWDWTALGEQHLLSEVLLLLLNRQHIDEEQLAPELKGYGDLPIKVNTSVLGGELLWQALGIPLQPALSISIQTPLSLNLERFRSQCLKRQ